MSQNEIRTKQSFGTITVARVSPPIPPEAPAAYNIHLTFEEALKLHLGLGQLLGKLNSYNRKTTAGKQSAANLCLFPHKSRITLNEAKLKPSRDGPQ